MGIKNIDRIPAPIKPKMEAVLGRADPRNIQRHRSRKRQTGHEQDIAVVDRVRESTASMFVNQIHSSLECVARQLSLDLFDNQSTDDVPAYASLIRLVALGQHVSFKLAFRLGGSAIPLRFVPWGQIHIVFDRFLKLGG